MVFANLTEQQKQSIITDKQENVILSGTPATFGLEDAMKGLNTMRWIKIEGQITIENADKIAGATEIMNLDWDWKGFSTRINNLGGEMVYRKTDNEEVEVLITYSKSTGEVEIVEEDDSDV